MSFDLAIRLFCWLISAGAVIYYFARKQES